MQRQGATVEALDLLLQGVEALGTAGGDCHLGAVAGQEQREVAPQAARGTGDQGRAA